MSNLRQAGARIGGSPEKFAMSTMKHFAAAALLCVAASLPVLAQEKQPENSQDRSQEQQKNRYVPRLNTLMMVSQLGHFKLWYAGAVQNWPLANYELGQIRANMLDAKNLYPNNSKSDMSTMATPADDLDDAIKAKDSVKFTKAFSKLTAACNSCHEATGFGFIKIREPRLSPIETSPFSDESFSGK
jgi:cytochrome c553